jgi:hypothetical protein
MNKETARNGMRLLVTCKDRDIRKPSMIVQVVDTWQAQQLGFRHVLDNKEASRIALYRKREPKGYFTTTAGRRRRRRHPYASLATTPMGNPSDGKDISIYIYFYTYVCVFVCDKDGLKKIACTKLIGNV